MISETCHVSVIQKCWVHQCGCWASIYGTVACISANVGCIYVDVGCLSMERLDGCIYAETLCGCWVHLWGVGSFPKRAPAPAP